MLTFSKSGLFLQLECMELLLIKEEEGECESPQGLTLVSCDFVPNESQQQQLDETLQKFPNVLCDKPGKTEVATLSILTGDALPISSHPYRITS